MEGTWARLANCAGDTGTMYPSDLDERGIREAKANCAGCPVRPECLEEALARSEQYGVWGGLTTPERRNLRRQRIRKDRGARIVASLDKAA